MNDEIKRKKEIQDGIIYVSGLAAEETIVNHRASMLIGAQLEDTDMQRYQVYGWLHPRPDDAEVYDFK